MTASVSIEALMQESGVKFGTSGARGLVTAMTDRVCYAYTKGFLQALAGRGEIQPGMEVALAGDLRPSTRRIMAAVARAVADGGYRLAFGGEAPSPAIALTGLVRRIPSIMVTGSHIPDDRNGIKFNKTTGEILKADETLVRAQTVELPDLFDAAGALREAFKLPEADASVAREYVKRWVAVYPNDALSGMRVGVYSHSAVGRDLVREIMTALGAVVVELGRSEKFVPVDTEAIRPTDVELGLKWAKEHGLSAIVSTDGDSDRPLVADELGRWLRGDVAGILCARHLKADAVVTSVSCNGALELSNLFPRTRRTRIGSPFVIEGMLGAVAEGSQRVVGYEANGGFLTATDLPHLDGVLPALPTRDPVIVMLAILYEANQRGVPVSSLLEDLPARFTASERLENFPTERSSAKVAELKAGGPERLAAELGPSLGGVKAVNDIDGLRVTFASGDVIHVRPSGNAPELRCYTEADSEARAKSLVTETLARLESWR
jgi:phosphomannomutase